jgi:hypothetical protein
MKYLKVLPWDRGRVILVIIVGFDWVKRNTQKGINQRNYELRRIIKVKI